jgi:hypothetical protein
LAVHGESCGWNDSLCDPRLTKVRLESALLQEFLLGLTRSLFHFSCSHHTRCLLLPHLQHNAVNIYLGQYPGLCTCPDFELPMKVEAHCRVLSAAIVKIYSSCYPQAIFRPVSTYDSNPSAGSCAANQDLFAAPLLTTFLSMQDAIKVGYTKRNPDKISCGEMSDVVFSSLTRKFAARLCRIQ